ncbi:MAG TPA: hypothetical protein VGR62_26340 [Candidatus Binatia bacterium]|jgi:hypothetical protein|nr:hypothetical protein [Candidatus Binatia bacterium]
MLPNASSWSGVVLLSLTAVAPVWGDPWERAPGDNGPTTLTELAHGSEEIHDLKGKKGADEDWWRISQKGHSSYEVVVDATTSSAVPVALDRMAADGTTVLQSAVAVGAGAVRSLRWENTVATTVDGQFVRVKGACTKCARDDGYRIRFYETTYAVSRFNNSGTQVTVLVVQNPTDYPVTGNARFWDATGDLVGSSGFALAPKATAVVNTSPIAPDVSGSVTVASDARYGDLAGKTVALEPATGFSFDTEMKARPR